MATDEQSSSPVRAGDDETSRTPSGGERLPATAPEDAASPPDRAGEFGFMVHGVEGYDGPIPHPRHLDQYERILPGAADRILRMAERQQEASIEMARHAQIDETADRRRGMRFGFGAFVLLAGGALVCGFIDQPLLGGAFLATSAVSAIAVFVKGRQSRR